MTTMPSSISRLHSLLRHKSFGALVKDGTLVNVKTAAMIHDYSRQHFYRMIRAGKLKPLRRGDGHFYFFANDLTQALYHNGR